MDLPIFNLHIQIKVFNEISKIIKLNKIESNFLQLIINKRRIYFLDKILEKFIKLTSERKGKIDAILISSKELTSAELVKIQSELSNDFKSPIKIDYKHDPSLIGGLVIQVGSIMVDASIKTKLKQLEKNMIGS